MADKFKISIILLEIERSSYQTAHHLTSLQNILKMVLFFNQILINIYIYINKIYTI